jgi:two-component system osmolarity sensor histidine kinase EnvZ
MTQNPIKRYLPKSLLGRAILILLFPIIFIEIVVGIAFIQRHFEQVTNQMSEGIAFEILYIQNEAENGIKNKLSDKELIKKISNLGEKFGFKVNVSKKNKLTRSTKIDFVDLSGKIFVKNLKEKIDKKSTFDLSNPRKVYIQVLLEKGFLEFQISRKRISASNPHQLLVLMLFVTVLLVLLSLIILKNQIRPIGKLAKAAEAFGKGQFVEFKPGGSEEVRRAGIAFLAMRARIERQIKQRTQMLSGVSHDLRTPLTRLKLSLTLEKKSTEIKEMLEDVNSMEAMLDEFLEFSKSNIKEKSQKVVINDFIKTIVIRNKKHFKNIDLVISKSLEKGFSMRLRINGVKRAIQNIIDNSITYGKKVIIKINKDKNSLVFEFEDDGIGIDEKNYVKAFRPFSRLDESRNQNNHSGVGLGLSIANDVVRMHGGQITLYKSLDLGGLGVRIRIPI